MRRHCLLAGLAVVWLVVVASCGPGSGQIAVGQELYTEHCARCHEVPGAIGPELSSRVLAAYGSARGLFNYVTVAMPYDNPGSLKEQEYWDSLAYLLSDRGLLPQGMTLGPDTAEGISFPPQ